MSDYKDVTPPQLAQLNGGSGAVTEAFTFWSVGAALWRGCGPVVRRNPPDDDEILFFCPDCSERELEADLSWRPSSAVLVGLGTAFRMSGHDPV
jgi:hypothetical protein